MKVVRLLRAAPVLLALGGLAGCGEDEVPAHGLRGPALESRPEGEAITVRYAARDGDAYVGRVRMQQRVAERRSGGPQPGRKQAESLIVLELDQTFRRPDAAGPLRSEIRLRCVEAGGKNAEAYLAREPITGLLEHDDDGRPRPHSLRLEGGTKLEQAEALDLLGTLLFAGLGGSPTWLPPRPVRPGEAWRLESFLRPRGVASAKRQARRLGVSAPTPVFTGSARLEAVQGEGDGALLEVRMEALIAIDGPFAKDGRRGTMSIGDRQRGTAWIRADTGLPVRFEVTHTGRKEVRAGDELVVQEFVTEVEGDVARELQAERGAGPDGR